MADLFLAFKKYNDIGLATDIGEYLKSEGVEYIVEDHRPSIDPMVTGDALNMDIFLKIKGPDFIKAQGLLDQYYKETIAAVEDDYYLFEFSDEELLGIISKPDEWGEFDYQLAQKILADRGKEIKPETIESLHENRIKELSKSETEANWLIYKGYLYAALGGIMAVFYGYNLANSKKTMRNGEQFYTYNQQVRKHGERIVAVGIIGTLFWICFLIYMRYLRNY